MPKFGEGRARPMPAEEEKSPKLEVIEGGAGGEDVISEEDITEVPEVTPEEIEMKRIPRRPRRRRYVTAEGRPIQATKAGRERFETERTAERAELEELRQDVMKRLEAIEQRIVETQEATEKARLEKELIQKGGELELESIEARKRERLAADEEARERMAAPMREVAREFGREQAFAERMREEAEYEEQLEVNEKGRIVGMKNIPYLDAGAVHLALPEMWKAHDAEREWLNKNRPPGWMQRMKELDLDAERMVQMRENADELIESGRKEARVRNFFYKHAEDVAVEGMNRAEYESLMITPEETLDRKYEDLQKQSDQMKDAIDAVYSEFKPLEAFYKGERAEYDAQEGLAKLGEQINDALRARRETLNADVASYENLRKPENLDVKAAILQKDIERARAMIETKKVELKTFSRNPEVKKSLQAELASYEEEATGAQRELRSWKKDPNREAAMQARKEALQELESKALNEIMEIDQKIDNNEAILARTQRRMEALEEEYAEAYEEEAIGEQVDILQDQLEYCMREFAKLNDKRTDVLQARMRLEAAALPSEEEVMEVREEELIEEEPEAKKAA